MSGTPDTTTPAVTEEDRAKALALWNEVLCNSGVPGWSALETIAAAILAERGKVDALRAAMHALAETLTAGRHPGGAVDLRDYVIARLRAIADGQR